MTIINVQRVAKISNRILSDVEFNNQQKFIINMEGSSKRVQLLPEAQQDQENSRVNQLLQEYLKNNDIDKQIKYEHRQQIAKTNHLLQNGWRKWLNQKGKGYLVDFDQRQRKKLKDFFSTLDKKKCGFIELDQLEEILLGLGLADGIEDVKRLIGTVDGNHSGKIQFSQFIEMIQDDRKQNQIVVVFFKQLILSQIEGQKQKQSLLTKLNFSKTVKPTESQRQIFKNRLPFQMIVNRVKRNHILSSMSLGRCKSRGSDKEFQRMLKGKEVVKALHKMDERRLMKKLRETMQQKIQLQTTGSAFLKNTSKI